jgi:molecular chaperone GrpE
MATLLIISIMLNKLKNFMSEEFTDSETKKPKKDKSASKEAEIQLALEQAQTEVDEAKDKYLRLFAEFDNYKKRSIKESFELRRTAAQDTIVSLLPVLDDFDRAKKSAESGNEIFSEGVSIVYQKLYATLEMKGLKEMESTGADFDPENHESITDIPAPTEEMKGKVIDTVEKGYILNEKIIRHAKVVVGK